MKIFDPKLTGSIEIQSPVIGGITSSLFGTASWATNVVNGSTTNILNTVTVGLVGSTGVDYNSIKTALSTITDASANKPYAVIVSPGVYIEDTMNVPQYVIVKGDSSTTTIISASNPNNRIFNMSDQSMLIDMQVQGSTGTGVSAIYYSSSTTPQTFAISYVENVRFGTNYTNATCEGLNGANIIMQCSNVKYGGYTSGSKSFDVGFVVTGSNSGIGRMQLRNVTSTNGGITGSADQVFALANGSGCTFIVNGCLLTKSTGAARGTGFLAYNGASLRLTAVNFQRWEKAIYMPNTGSAPSIFGSALNFENDTYDLLVEHPSASGKVDGLDTFLKSIIPVNAPLYEINQDPKKITVAKKGGDFSSISASVAWITDSAETNRYIIEVGPGKFVENEIDLRGRPYVSIVGSNIQTTEIFPSSSNQHIIRMGINNEISFLSLNGAGSGYSAIYVDDIGDFAQAHKVSIYDSDIGIKVNASTVDTQFYGEYIDINGTYTYGLYISSSNNFSSIVNMENYYQFPVASSITGNYVIGPYSSLSLNSTLMENDGTTNTVAFRFEDGSKLEASSLDVQGFDTAFYIPNIGLGPNIRASGVMIHDSLTYDFNNENASSNVRYDGIITGTKIVNNSPTAYWNRLDDVTGQSYMNSIESVSVTASFLGNLAGTASYVSGSVFSSTNPALSASYALSSSFVTGSIFTGANRVASSSYSITSSYVTGSIFVGSNQATSASYALSASFVTGSIFVGANRATSSSFAVTSSYVTGSIFAGSNQATSASYSLTASYSITASYALNGGSGGGSITVADEGIAQGTATFLNFTGAGVTVSPVTSNTASINIPGGAGDTFPYTGSAIISGSLSVTGSVGSTGGFTGSLFGTASYVTGSIFSAGNLALSSSFAVSASWAPGGASLSGGQDKYIARWSSTTTITTSSLYEGDNKNIGVNVTSFNVTNPEALRVSGSTINVISGEANIDTYTQLNIVNKRTGTAASSDIVATNDTGNEGGNYVDLGINSSTYAGAIGGPNDAYLYTTGSIFLIGNQTRGVDAQLKLFAGNDATVFPIVVTGSQAIITGSLLGSSSYALTASYALNGGGGGAAFPFSGTAVITGSIVLSTGSAIFPTLTAAESLAAGDFVNVYSGGVRKASNNDTSKQAHGFVIQAYNTSDPVFVYYSGLNTSITGLTAGSRYFLGTSGGETTTPPTSTGQLSQEVGVAISTTAILVNFGPAIVT